MKVLHVKVEQDSGWFIAQGLEEPGVITQGRTLDEIVANVREVVELMFDQKQVDIELLVPGQAITALERRRVTRASARRSSRKSGRRAA